MHRQKTNNPGHSVIPTDVLLSVNNRDRTGPPCLSRYSRFPSTVEISPHWCSAFTVVVPSSLFLFLPLPPPSPAVIFACFPFFYSEILSSKSTNLTADKHERCALRAFASSGFMTVRFCCCAFRCT